VNQRALISLGKKSALPAGSNAFRMAADEDIL